MYVYCCIHVLCRNIDRYFIMFVWSLSFLVASPLLAYRKTNVFKVFHQIKNTAVAQHFEFNCLLIG